MKRSFRSLLFFLVLALQLHGVHAQKIPGQYIVYYKDDVDSSAANERLFSSESAVASSASFHIVLELKNAIAVAGINDEQYQVLKEDEAVKKIIQDFVVHAAAEQRNPPNWGLDRIDQLRRKLDLSYTYTYDGTGVIVYIIDTAIRSTHQEFGGRVKCDEQWPAGCRDYNGHGTHVAGTVGGSTVGVAKNVTLVPIDVLGSDATGSFSGIKYGIEYVIGLKVAQPSTPMIINLSLGAREVEPEFEEIIDEAVAAGIVVVAAAGNNKLNACQFSPAYVPSAITVGASDRNDRCALFSNVGRCVDIFAPGVSIVSASADSDTLYTSLDGTSMAAPHVAGAAALYLQAHPEWTPDQVWNAMRDDALNFVRFAKGFPPGLRFLRLLQTMRTTRRLLQTQNV